MVRSPNKIESYLDFFESQFPNFDKVAIAISSSSVGWHIAHSFNVLQKVIETSIKSDPSSFKRNFNWKRTYIFFIGRIPRGKGKAPQAVQPKEEITEQSLKEQMVHVKSLIADFSKLNAKSYFTHPYFGDLNKKQTLYFLELHTYHHLKIIQDILT